MASAKEISPFETEGHGDTPSIEELYSYDKQEQRFLLDTKPWKLSADRCFFKKVWISTMALTKMILHTVSGGIYEVMGLMQGKILKDAFIVLDAFPLPVHGTETRVNAGEDANEYMINFQEASESAGKLYQICGWYHSHPGYGCWLSEIDIHTQQLYQNHQDPFLAIVIDPTQTMDQKQVEMGAFRCYSNIDPVNMEISLDEEIDEFSQKNVTAFGKTWKKFLLLFFEILFLKVELPLIPKEKSKKKETNIPRPLSNISSSFLSSQFNFDKTTAQRISDKIFIQRMKKSLFD
ncbi:Mov34/MPN/PAD-1 family protein [Cardiosporidium cionae]|uniref:Mov34/MPN/PAD-1 family protein n=1 Tax=Cardiosporidium cionae TaxID=476202 RepID=A0ABQ7JEM1_9APIC|nr:Mov34/MPN/PAD-1 family protein [Cardiosporidium cionae]|eukprot:KAF8822452.1 Mov34/MPN/PAD-1 family protein [Cardiosporidium cionae]